MCDGLRAQRQETVNFSREARDLIAPVIAHNEEKHSVYLFLRTADKRGGQPVPYTYLGRLKYVEHDNEVEQPVYFDWQMMDWPAPAAVLDSMHLHLEDANVGGELPVPAHPEPSAPMEWAGVQVPIPAQGTPKGTPTSSFKTRGKPDYAEKDKKTGLWER
ncbi:MAG TPA: hypothetical protein VHZ32_01560 [Rhizomicrobium sp.]|nr:hypothetical protein [Rhizomicrobium sp.]